MTYDQWLTTNPEDAQYCVCGRYWGDCLMPVEDRCVVPRLKDWWSTRCPEWDPAPEPAYEAPDR